MIFWSIRFPAGKGKSMGRLKIQFLIPKGQWYSKFLNEKKTTSTEWTLSNIDFTESNYVIKLVIDEVDTTLADMCFSNIMITHSIFWMDLLKSLRIHLNQSQNKKWSIC